MADPALFVLEGTIQPGFRTAFDLLKELGLQPSPEESRFSEPMSSNIRKSIITAHIPRHYLRATLVLDENIASKHTTPGSADKAWTHQEGRKKLSHLLKDPPCTCGASVSAPSQNGRRQTITIIHDTHRHIDPFIQQENQVVGLLLPQEIEQKVKAKPASVEIQEDKYTVKVADHADHKNILPNLHPASTHQMISLIANAEEIVQKWNFIDAGNADALVYDQETNEPIHILRIMQIIHEEQVLYNAIFFEVIRQCTVHCTERGQLLSDIRRAYSEVLSAIPAYLIGIHNEMLMQRSIERRLVEAFLHYKLWWKTIRFRFDMIKSGIAQGKELERLTHSDTTNEAQAIIPMLEDDDYLSKKHAQIFAVQRAFLQSDEQDIRSEKLMWRDLTYALCGQLTSSRTYEAFRKVHASRLTWEQAAVQAYEDIVAGDQQQVQELRNLTKLWISDLTKLEKRLSGNEMAVLEVLRNIRSELHETIGQFLGREGTSDAETTDQIRENFRRWILGINQGLGRFKAEEAKSNLLFTQQNRRTFETLVLLTLRAMVSQHQREKDLIVVHQGEVHNKPISQDVLMLSAAVKPDHFQRRRSIEHSHFHKLAATDDIPQLSRERDFNTELSEEEFQASTDIFAQLAGTDKQTAAKLVLLKHSQLYCGMYRMWQRFTELQPVFRKRIFGEGGFPLLLSHMEEKLEFLLALTAESSYFNGTVLLNWAQRVNSAPRTDPFYFCLSFLCVPGSHREPYLKSLELAGPEPQRFCSVGYSVLHEIDELIEKFHTNFDVSSHRATSTAQTMRGFVNSSRTWFELCENGLLARTQSVHQQIIEYSELMLRVEANLLNVTMPDQAFDEERYAQLFQNRTSVTAEARLKLLELQLGSLSREIGNLSRVLDDQDSAKSAATSGRKISKLASSWSDQASSLLQARYKSRAMPPTEIKGSPLQEAALEDPSAVRKFDVSDLFKLVKDHTDKLDFVETELSGLKTCVYVKPFALWADEKRAKNTDEDTESELVKLETALDHQKAVNEAVQERVADMEHAIEQAKVSLTKNVALSQALKLNNGPRPPVGPQFTDVAVVQMELMRLSGNPVEFRIGTEPDVDDLGTIPSWEELTGENIPDTPFGEEQSKVHYNLAKKMREVRRSLRASQELLAEQRKMLEPVLVPDEAKAHWFAERSQERDLRKTRRRSLMVVVR